MKLHITKGAGKMEYINSINTSTVECKFCQFMAKKEGTICQKCYARQYERFRSNLHDKLVYNTEIMTDPLYEPEELNILKVGAIIRVHSFGEFQDMVHFDNFIKLVMKNPSIRFVAWTKRKDLLLSWKYPLPVNLRLIYSNPYIDRPMFTQDIPDKFHAVFNVFTADYAKANHIRINCMGACIDCMNCYGDHMAAKVINEVIKSQQTRYKKLTEAKP